MLRRCTTNSVPPLRVVAYLHSKRHVKSSPRALALWTRACIHVRYVESCTHARVLLHVLWTRACVPDCCFVQPQPKPQLLRAGVGTESSATAQLDPTLARPDYTTPMSAKGVDKDPRT